MIEETTGVGVTDSVSTDTPTEAALSPVTEEIQTVDADQVETPAVEAEVESTDAVEDDSEQVLAETEADDGTPLVKKLRDTIKKLQKSQASPPQEINKEAEELYQGLTSFDNEKGVPSARPFAEKLAAKDPKLAYQAGVDIFNLPVPNDANGWTFGHHYLKANGIDPTRLDDVRSFLEGGQQVTSYQEIPEFVPPEYHDAFKSYSPGVRESLEFQLDDPDTRQGALEVLQDRQWKLDQQKTREEGERQSQARLAQEIETEVEADAVQTFTRFVEDFEQSPTFTNVQVSANPTVDKVIKSSINQQMLNLAEPNSVAGQQALRLFKELGVEINLKEIEQYLGIINGSIETSVKAGKGGYQANKAQADAQKAMAVQRLSGIRNSIFTQALKKLAGSQMAASQAQGETLKNNAGLPTFGESSQVEQGQKIDTLAWIKQRASQP
jgi:hypothetical protein